MGARGWVADVGVGYPCPLPPLAVACWVQDLLGTFKITEQPRLFGWVSRPDYANSGPQVPSPPVASRHQRSPGFGEAWVDSTRGAESARRRVLSRAACSHVIPLPLRDPGMAGVTQPRVVGVPGEYFSPHALCPKKGFSGVRGAGSFSEHLKWPKRGSEGFGGVRNGRGDSEPAPPPPPVCDIALYNVYDT